MVGGEVGFFFFSTLKNRTSACGVWAVPKLYHMSVNRLERC